MRTQSKTLRTTGCWAAGMTLATISACMLNSVVTDQDKTGTAGGRLCNHLPQDTKGQAFTTDGSFRAEREGLSEMLIPSRPSLASANTT